MSKTQLKTDLKNWIDAIQDTQMLLQLLQLKEQLMEDPAIHVGEAMSQSELEEKVVLARERIKEGYGISMEELEAEMKQW